MDFLKLIRYKNLLMVLITMVLTKYALIPSFIPNSYLSDFYFSILTLSVLLITAGGYIINDIYDIERLNRKMLLNLLEPYEFYKLHTSFQAVNDLFQYLEQNHHASIYLHQN